MNTQVSKNDNPATGDARPHVRVGLIGQGIQLSRTPGMHRAAAAALGIDLTYDLLDTDEMSPPNPPVADLLRQAEAEGYAGLNITYPYKREVIGSLDGLSDAARRVGAVNTVVFRDGKRFGHNTDYWGFAKGLQTGLREVDLRSVLLLGAGGAGGAVAHALAGAGVERLMIHDLDRDGAARLAREVEAASPGCAASAVDDLGGAAGAADGIVNATPMGMAKLPGTAIDPDLLQTRHWVADIVYFPLETALLKAARDRGCQTLSGAGMAIYQAVRAFELFTGQVPDVAEMTTTFESFTR
ncbi:shikimate dehydrogenase [Salipiger sp. IMCC34102]|uniref:shikimate dehydrogenase n=1 Tax=Salipiger sp. IMCC34102 TaxID=2510647 RepID=UPI00101C5AC7|nr:shikimate dehydrogenase [Salipiger sp. IMCC34102]RYH04440.1 shikimate dehydrogenase [Salipiger sp. IMCC34102]